MGASHLTTSRMEATTPPNAKLHILDTSRPPQWSKHPLPPPDYRPATPKHHSRAQAPIPNNPGWELSAVKHRNYLWRSHAH